MKLLLERSRYLLLIAIIGSLLASFASLAWSGYKVVRSVLDLFSGSIPSSAVSVSFIELMDGFLIATVLYIFAVALYELFIGDLNLPAWLVIHNLDELKARLISVVILVIVIAFAEHFVEWHDTRALLEGGIGAAVVIAALVLYNRFGAGHA